MNSPWYKDAAFYGTVATSIAAVIGGILTDAEVELFLGALAPIVAYLIRKGILIKQDMVAAAKREQMILSHQHLMAELKLSNECEAADK